MSSFADEIQRLITNEPNDLALEKALQARALKRTADFALSDGSWALALYDRSPYIFGDFILKHLSNQPQHRETVDALLKRAEADDQQDMFRQLYRWIYTEARWNDDVRQLVASAPDFNTIARAMVYREQNWQTKPTIDADVLIRLYERDPAAYVRAYQHGDNSAFKLPTEGMEPFRQIVSRYNESFALTLFRRYATPDEWHGEVRRLIDERADQIAQKLESRFPQNIDPELPPELEGTLIDTFGDAVMPYLNKHSRRHIRRRIEAALTGSPDDEALITRLNLIQAEAFQHFRQADDLWAMALYERNFDFFEPFLLNGLNAQSTRLRAMLERARQDGRYDFYRRLYVSQYPHANWNSDVLAAAESTDDAYTLLRELERLDLQREQRYVNVKLDGQTAAALYRRGGNAAADFIWRYLPNGGQGYEDLLKAIEEAGDMNFFRRVFRKVASDSAWHAEMQALLEQDIPAERILAELEQRKPANPQQIKPAILAAFMQKYGEAVLPFFENYVDWVTPRRMQGLFSLDIDRGALLRELQAIARRQPTEFAQRAELWALPLYERSPEFFTPFITRHLNAWEARKFVEKFLARVEADGHDSLFRELYTRFHTGQSWEQDIARVLRSGLDDDALAAALNRRTTSWQHLPDDLAVELYRRNPDRFRDFIIEHVGSQRWNVRVYPRLQKEAEQRGDTAFKDAVMLKSSPQKTVKHLIEDLLKRDAPADEAVETLSQLKQSSLAQIDDKSVIGQLVERYGDAVMPFIIDDFQTSWWRRDQSEGLRQAVERHASKSNYWRFMFATRQVVQWQEALVHAARTAPDEAAFRAELIYLMPDDDQFGEMDEATALAIYQRYPDASRPLVERFYKASSIDLFRLGEQNSDEDFLDYLTYRMLLAVNQLTYRAYPVSTRFYRQSADMDARRQIEEMGQIAITRFERLYAEAPQHYVAHAAQVLSFVNPFELGGSWNWRPSPLSNNPIWTYLITQHTADWQQSPEGITALLESPNIFVQLLAFDLLSGGGRDAAARVRETLPSFKAFLLSRAFKKAKWKALACLEAAARDDAETAGLILPTLRETMDYQGRRAVSDEIAVAVARVEGLSAED